jgi:hypothetical protein
MVVVEVAFAGHLGDVRAGELQDFALRVAVFRGRDTVDDGGLDELFHGRSLAGLRPGATWRPRWDLNPGRAGLESAALTKLRRATSILGASPRPVEGMPSLQAGMACLDQLIRDGQVLTHESVDVGFTHGAPPGGAPSPGRDRLRPRRGTRLPSRRSWHVRSRVIGRLPAGDGR